MSSEARSAANEPRPGPYYFESLRDEYPRFVVCAFDGSVVRTYSGSFALVYDPFGDAPGLTLLDEVAA